MSLVLDDEKIAAVAALLKLASDIGDGVYESVENALKVSHPQLVPAELPGDESAKLKGEADAAIAKKFGAPDIDAQLAKAAHDTDPSFPAVKP